MLDYWHIFYKKVLFDSNLEEYIILILTCILGKCAWTKIQKH